MKFSVYIVACSLIINLPVNLIAGVGNGEKCHPVFGCGGQDEKGEKGDKGDKGDKGRSGPEAPKGEPGEPGKDGAIGEDGADANTNALEGTVRHMQETKYILQGEIRLFDSRKFKLNVFGQYDIRHTRGHQVGIGLTYKIGKSYEERQIEKLKETIDILLKHAHYPLNSKTLIVPKEDK